MHPPTRDPVISLDLALVAWAAGFFDGEGSVCIQKENRRHHGLGQLGYDHVLRVTVGQNYRKPLDELCAYFGGYVYRVSERHHSWVIDHAKAAAFLRAVRPFLRVKGPAADCGLLLQERKRAHGAKRGKWGDAVVEGRERDVLKVRLQEINRASAEA